MNTLHKRLVPLAAIAAMVAAGATMPSATATPDTAKTSTVTIYAVNAPVGERADALANAGYDVMERRDGDTLFVVGDADTAAKLARDGFSARVSETQSNPEGTRSISANGDTFYGGYHTPQGVFNAMQRNMDAHPQLMRSFDIGRTYSGKFPMRAYCITADASSHCDMSVKRPSDRSRFFVMTQTHAREIATSEVALRWVADVLDRSDRDADIAHLLSTTEIWIVPAANPDGHDYVASGYRPTMQRKNRNPENGRHCTGDEVGVDLNRNMDSRWGTTGVSRNPCADTYPGPRAESEVENQALRTLWLKLFADQRGDSEYDKAPVDTSGFFLSIHSVAGMNLFPWQGVRDHAPNDTELRAIWTNVAHFNDYSVGQAPELLYSASGGHDDWAYDKLGVASGTIELGGRGQCGRGFHPPYSCVDTYMSQNGPAMDYMAKLAAKPYELGRGGVVKSASVRGRELSADVVVTKANDDKPGDWWWWWMNRAAAASTEVQYSFSADFRDATDMRVSGSTATATLNTSGLNAGRHMVFVRAKDAATGIWGPATAVWVTVN